MRILLSTSLQQLCAMNQIFTTQVDFRSSQVISMAVFTYCPHLLDYHDKFHSNRSLQSSCKLWETLIILFDNVTMFSIRNWSIIDNFWSLFLITIWQFEDCTWDCIFSFKLSSIISKLSVFWPHSAQNENSQTRMSTIQNSNGWIYIQKRGTETDDIGG